MNNDDRQGKSGMSRRNFLKVSGAITAGIGVSGVTNFLWLRDGIAAIEVSEGYILVDTKKCQGCLTCMLACSLVHEGEESLSLSRIQVLQNSFEKWPDDLTIEQCRQCETAQCVEACPVGALTANPDFGYVRMVDQELCVGCGECMRACPVTPSRAVLADEEGRSLKCDLCANTPYWDTEGGPYGKQACVEVCPIGAIAFTSDMPVQQGDSGYKVNLRNFSWGVLGFPMD